MGRDHRGARGIYVTRESIWDREKSQSRSITYWQRLDRRDFHTEKIKMFMVMRQKTNIAF